MRKKRKKIVIYATIAFFIIVMIVGVTKTRLFVWRAIRPVAKILVYGNQSLSDYYKGIRSINQISAENNQLKSENLRLLQQQSEIENLKIENKKLSDLLNFTDQNKNLNFRHGEVIARPSLGSISNIVINLGSEDSIQEGNLVISDGFLIGVVKTVASKTAEVGLITGNSVKVAALLQDTRSLGLLGGGNGGIKMENIVKDSPLTVGQSVVTAGITPNTKTGIPIGKIERILSQGSDIYQQVQIQSPIDFNKIEIISVVL